MGKRCDEGKARYATHHDAVKAILGIAWKRVLRPEPGRPIPIRAYRCPFCHRWHITSAERKPVPAWRIKKQRQYRALLARRAAETPLFDRLVRARGLKGHTWL